MNSKLSFIPLILTASLILSSCQIREKPPAEEEPFVQDAFPQASVYHDYYIKMNENQVLTYYDLAERTQSPACVIAGCTHDKKSPGCTAFSSESVMHQPFVYGDSLYFFEKKDHQEFLYKCNLNGSNRQEVLRISGDQIDQDTYSSPSINQIKISNSMMYITIDYQYYVRQEGAFFEFFELGKKNHFTLLGYDLESGEFQTIYQTAYQYNVGFLIYGIYDGRIYCHESHLSKEIVFESAEEWRNALMDPDSEFRKSIRNRSFTIDAADGTIIETTYQEDSSFLISKSGCYYNTPDGLYTQQGELIASGTLMETFASAEGLLYKKQDAVYFYQAGESKEIGKSDGYAIVGESRNYLILWSPDFETVVCSKSDYFSGKRVYFKLEDFTNAGA